jgi:hypothetical protein
MHIFNKVLKLLFLRLGNKTPSIRLPGIRICLVLTQLEAGSSATSKLKWWEEQRLVRPILPSLQVGHQV